MTDAGRRLIEDLLPLDDLNAIASTEKLHPRPYVGLVHYWPARRPTTASRAAVYSALVSAPKAEEREAAKAFVTALAEYRPSQEIVKAAQERIRKMNGGKAPKVLDLFAGGGAIPLEAARLGCESYALDYNPVAHLIELCTLVYPQKFKSRLADEFEHWSRLVHERVRQEVGDLYQPLETSESREVKTSRGLFGGHGSREISQVEPLAYIWSRTVPCRRPGCDAPVPLVRQAWLSKKGQFVAAIPKVEDGNRLTWKIVSGNAASDVSHHEKQTGAGQAVCVHCNTPIPIEHVKEMACTGYMSESLAAIVGSLPPKRLGSKKRIKVYLPPPPPLRIFCANLVCFRDK